MKVNNLLKYSLSPISFLWDRVYRARRFFYRYGVFDQVDCQVPIISIGNLAFGGTGKTPFTLWMAKFLGSRQRKVMILMRGYKGKLEHSYGIIKSGRKLGYNPFEYGDEAILMIRQLSNASIVVGKKRADNLKYYFDSELPDIVLLDDGHQHLNLGRSLNIVLFDALMPLSSYRTPPLGFLREGLTALSDADLIVLSRCDQVSIQKLNSLKSMIRAYTLPETPIAEVKYRPLGLFSKNYQQIMTLSELKDFKVICLAAIASPESFFKTIEEYGPEVVKVISYPDHHFFSKAELLEIRELAEKEDAYIITTEKDFVKIRKIIDDKRFVYLGIEVDFLKGQDEVEELVLKTMEDYV